MAQAYSYAGQKEKVRPLLMEALQSGVYACPYESAVTAISIGDMDGAMKFLDQAYAKRSNCLVFLRVDPRLQPLRDDPRYRSRYQELLALVGLDDEHVRSYPR